MSSEERFKLVIAKLNLASQPFRNRTLPWTITATLTVISLVALIFIIRASMQTNAQADAVERDVKQLRLQDEKLRKDAEQVKESLTPEQAQTLLAAHALDDRKRFSWSRLLADLEAAMPNDVRVTRIGVRDVAVRGGRTVADLDLAVVARTPTDVTEMIAEMDRGGIFQAEPQSQTLQKGRGESGTEWALLVHYTPRAGVPLSAERESGLANITKANAVVASNGGAQ